MRNTQLKLQNTTYSKASKIVAGPVAPQAKKQLGVLFFDAGSIFLGCFAAVVCSFATTSSYNGTSHFEANDR